MGRDRKRRSYLVMVVLFLLWFVQLVQLSLERDTLHPGDELTGYQFLESPNKLFRLKFFNLEYSGGSNRYLGIQYMMYRSGDMKMVWVANRDNPLTNTINSHWILYIGARGNLVLRNGDSTPILINPGSQATSSNTSATLLDTGNLVLKAGEDIVWQSFDHPTDTFLPGMKLGLLDVGQKLQPRNHSLTSWLSPEFPALGEFTLGLDPNDTNQLVIWRKHNLYWRSGKWNGQNFSYFPAIFDDPAFKFSYISNENESYFVFTVPANYISSWIEMNSSGKIHMFLGDKYGGWTLWYVPTCDENENYARSGACIDQTPSNCSRNDEFLQTIGDMDRWDFLKNHSLGPNDCEEICRNNCSCKAFASAKSDGTGCKFSSGIKKDEIHSWQSFYIRNSSSMEKNNTGPDIERNTTTETQRASNPKKNQKWVTIVGPLVSLIVLAIICSLCCSMLKYCFYFRGKQGSQGKDANMGTEVLIRELRTSMAAIKELSGTHKLKSNGKQDHELPLFSFSAIESATGRFSDANKLGQGGFGPVYKGTLADGQEIAVKRLSRRSGQGVEELKNEAMLISNLQHRNLVRVLGCCIKGEEKILVYEYLPNKSLDSFLFDATKRVLLDWKKRMHIIEGIAQGLLYLHKYSRLRIIHRDLKTSNILLDSNMNPKISDFGTAKIFGENESGANTNRIVGTYGYMSPEYALKGLFSEKSDVFSFGVMVLEILSGKKNSGFYQPNEFSNLLEYAWYLWKEGRYLELLDQAVAETCTATSEFRRCVEVGLFCVQESAEDRPTMSDVVSMLGGGGDSVTVSGPKQPAFSTLVKQNSVENPGTCSVNDVSYSTLQAR
ncbi:G-type lectin S-receptor-like serine/threonine-protein kinase At1g67520 isoform X2 [Ziziphus jujuba]|uniref:Receptor-like serine/threonine-protein kinase n=1 Tax=Ziziphus jujuba TaxID=326968 RepID=A0ABM3IF64_ZIZJJ|nr:G-type lectin S-receptor-like serine/threonine-protein kinase At1g67520 isoform X2 [Ziziphus jujuba]